MSDDSQCSKKSDDDAAPKAQKCASPLNLTSFQRRLANPNRSLFKPDAILDLQRTMGNQAVRQLISGESAQTNDAEESLPLPPPAESDTGSTDDNA